MLRPLFSNTLIAIHIIQLFSITLSYTSRSTSNIRKSVDFPPEGDSANNCWQWYFTIHNFKGSYNNKSKPVSKKIKLILLMNWVDHWRFTSIQFKIMLSFVSWKTLNTILNIQSRIVLEIIYREPKLHRKHVLYLVKHIYI